MTFLSYASVFQLLEEKVYKFLHETEQSLSLLLGKL